MLYGGASCYNQTVLLNVYPYCDQNPNCLILAELWFFCLLHHFCSIFLQNFENTLKFNRGSAPGNKEFYSQHESIDWFQIMCAANRIPGCYMIRASVEIKKSWEAGIFRYFEKSRETWSICTFFTLILSF